MNPKIVLENQMQILQAVRDGNQIMFRLHAQKGPWQIVKEDHLFNFGFNDYAVGGIPKEKTYRPWAYEEIPVGSVVKHKTKNLQAVIVSKCVNAHGQTVVWIGCGDCMGTSTILDEYVLTDGTICGVEE
jgi:hypothetical protein